MSKLFGIHIDSKIDNIISEATRVKNIGCNILQLFVEPMTKKRQEYNFFYKYLKDNNISCVVHISYTINCAQDWTQYSWWIKQCIMEIELSSLIGAYAVVIHLGKQLGLSIEESYNNMYTSLLYIHSQTKLHSKVKILLETSSGQGSEICFKIEDLSHFYKKMSEHKNEDIRKRFGLCVDTCHIFASGYDIKSKKKFIEYLNKFDKMIGIEHIKLIHLNDSKKECGSNVDRHENIGNGFIGEKPLMLFVEFAQKVNIPIILETPQLLQNKDVEMVLKMYNFK